MIAGGVPNPNPGALYQVLKAGFEIRDFMLSRHNVTKQSNLPCFKIRIGIHTGQVVAGIIGSKKFQYDIWGDAVNTAARLEGKSEPGKINITEFCYEQLKRDPELVFESRGEISVQGKGNTPMWFVEPKSK